MSLLQFSDTTNKKGIIEVIARRTGTSNATSSSYPLLDKTVDVNFALANFFIIANQYAGRNQPVDDINHIDYPIIYADITAGEQDIVLTLDQNGNQVLDIYKIRIQYPDGSRKTLVQKDIMDEDDAFLNDTTTGLPITYELTAGGIFLHQIPNYSLVEALEVYISRGASYFVSTDTTKVAGIPEIFQEYLTLRPSYFYCLEKGLPQATSFGIQLYGRDGKSGMEGEIRKYYSNRNRAEKRRILPSRQNNK
jgi:hypothetical protein